MIDPQNIDRLRRLHALAPHPASWAITSKPLLDDARLESLSIGGDGRALGDERVAIVAKMPQAAQLRRLVLYGLDKISGASWKALAGARFDALESVLLGASMWIPRGTVRHVLFDAPWLSGVRALSLDEVDEAEVALMRERVRFRDLVALGLSFRTGKTPARPDLGDSIASMLESCQELRLTHTTDAVVPALIATGIVPGLERLFIPRAALRLSSKQALPRGRAPATSCFLSVSTKRASSGLLLIVGDGAALLSGPPAHGTARSPISTVRLGRRRSQHARSGL